MYIKYSRSAQGHMDLLSVIHRTPRAAVCANPHLLACIFLLLWLHPVKYWTRTFLNPRAYIFWHICSDFIAMLTSPQALKTLEFSRRSIFFFLDKRKWLAPNTRKSCVIFLSWNVISSHRVLRWHPRGEWEGGGLCVQVIGLTSCCGSNLTFPHHLQCRQGPGKLSTKWLSYN